MRRHRTSWIALLPLVFAGGCDFLLPGGKAPRQSSLDAVLAEIHEEVGVPRAESVAQCRAPAFGDKPCGGPSRYVVYSTAASDEARLRRLAGRFTRLEAERNRALGLVSDCMLLSAPQPVLEDGVCTAPAYRREEVFEAYSFPIACMRASA